MDWNITDASYKDLIFSVAIPKPDPSVAFGVLSQEIVNERRLQISEKPLVDGAQIEDFGRKPRIFSADVIFFGADYNEKLKLFETKLNEGTSGKLILPDLSEAVYAKYQKHSRKTSATDGRSTVLSVSWIEDITKENLLRPSNLISKNSTSALAQSTTSIAAKANSVKQLANKAQATIDSNPVINAVKKAQSAITTARVTINSVLNVPKNLREQILSTTASLKADIASLKKAINGITHFSDLLALGLSQENPTQYNTGLGAVDYATVGAAVTTQVSGTNQVVVDVEPDITPIQSYEEARVILVDLVKVITQGKHDLEVQTQGSTSDFSKGAVQLINETNDLILLISNPISKQIMTDAPSTTLLEVCFANGKGVADIEDVYQINLHVEDILDIPRFTVINL